MADIIHHGQNVGIYQVHWAIRQLAWEIIKAATINTAHKAYKWIEIVNK